MVNSLERKFSCSAIYFFGAQYNFPVRVSSELHAAAFYYGLSTATQSLFYYTEDIRPKYSIFNTIEFALRYFIYLHPKLSNMKPSLSSVFKISVL